MLTIAKKMMTTAAPTARRAAMALRPRVSATPLPTPVGSVLPRRERSTWASAQKNGGAQPQPQPQKEAKTELQRCNNNCDNNGVVAKNDLDAFSLMPFSRMSSYMDEMHREMDDMMSAFGMPRLGTSLMRPYEMMNRLASPMFDLIPQPPAFFNLNVDLQEDDKAYTLRAEVPGFGSDDVKVTISPDGLLTISGNAETQQEEQEEAAVPEPAPAADAHAKAEGAAEGAQQQQEEAKADAPSSPAAPPKSRVVYSSVSSFTRSFRLPQDVNVDEASAAAKDGVLTVTLPKLAAPTPKEVPVTAAAADQ